MFDTIEFQELKVNQCFRFEPSFFAEKYIVSDNGMVHKLSDKLGEEVKVRVPPGYKVYTEQLFSVHYEGLGYASGEVYGTTIFEPTPGELFTKPEVREFIHKLQGEAGFDKGKITISRAI